RSCGKRDIAQLEISRDIVRMCFKQRLELPDGRGQVLLAQVRQSQIILAVEVFRIFLESIQKLDGSLGEFTFVVKLFPGLEVCLRRFGRDSSKRISQHAAEHHRTNENSHEK